MIPKSKIKRCRDCRLLFFGGTRCDDARTDGKKACERFKKGHPFRPKYKGRLVKEIDFDPDESQGWAFWTAPRVMLLLLWEVDTDDRGCWKLLQLAFNDAGLVTKVLRADEPPTPAFFGEVLVKGSGGNDLWASTGWEDSDAADYEGNVTNKPREVHILPARSE